MVFVGGLFRSGVIVCQRGGEVDRVVGVGDFGIRCLYIQLPLAAVLLGDGDARSNVYKGRSGVCRVGTDECARTGLGNLKRLLCDYSCSRNIFGRKESVKTM